MSALVCRIAIVSQGLDPMIGYLHACRSGRAALVYDLMEPLRPRVDRLVLGFVHSHTFSPADFVLGSGGVCRLHPQLARQVALSTPKCEEVQGAVVRLAKPLENRTSKQTSS